MWRESTPTLRKKRELRLFDEITTYPCPTFPVLVTAGADRYHNGETWRTCRFLRRFLAKRRRVSTPWFPPRRTGSERGDFLEKLSRHSCKGDKKWR